MCWRRCPRKSFGDLAIKLAVNSPHLLSALVAAFLSFAASQVSQAAHAGREKDAVSHRPVKKLPLLGG